MHLKTNWSNSVGIYGTHTCRRNRRWGGGGATATPGIFQMSFWGKKVSNIRSKPLDFRASAGENIQTRDLSAPPPPPNETGPIHL